MAITDEYRLIVELATSSASLDRSPNKNWVERSGNLPPYIRKLARAIEKTGKPLSQAISIAIGRCKAWASGRGDVTAKTRAKAAAAVAQWEALKAKNSARKLVKASSPYGDYIFLTETGSYSTELVRRAWQDKQRQSEQSEEGYQYVHEIWNDFIIVDGGEDGLFEKVPFTVERGIVTFHEPILVRQEYVEVEDLLDDEEQRLLDEYLSLTE